MARPLRLEFAGATYHVTARGDGREDIYLSDADRRLFLAVLGSVAERFNWTIHAYCLMSNHYHLLVETPEGNLSKGMRQLNGVYTQDFNRTHHRVGHVFQGRYKAILVEKEAYLLELVRYVVLNPVRAGMVRTPGEWPWSSYRATSWRRMCAGLAGSAMGSVCIWRDRSGSCWSLCPFRCRWHRPGSAVGAVEAPDVPGIRRFRRCAAASGS
jgi:REP element-mobilizing transposase RayT